MTDLIHSEVIIQATDFPSEATIRVYVLSTHHAAFSPLLLSVISVSSEISLFKRRGRLSLKPYAFGEGFGLRR